MTNISGNKFFGSSNSVSVKKDGSVRENTVIGFKNTLGETGGNADIVIGDSFVRIYNQKITDIPSGMQSDYTNNNLYIGGVIIDLSLFEGKISYSELSKLANFPKKKNWIVSIFDFIKSKFSKA